MAKLASVLSKYDIDVVGEGFDSHEGEELPDIDERLVRTALAHVDPDCSYEEWLTIGMALKATTNPELGLAIWDEWSSGALWKEESVKYESGACEGKWRGFRKEDIRLGSLFYLAEEYGYEGHGFAGAGMDEGDWDEDVDDELPDADTEEGEPPQKQSAFVLLGSYEPEEPKWTIERFIMQDTPNVLYGSPGTYKSFLALDMALCVATGVPWQSRFVVNPGPAFLIAHEGRHGLRVRMEAWCRYYNIPADSVPLLHLNKPWTILTQGKRGAVDHITTVKRLYQEMLRATEQYAEILKRPPSLIVLDTLSRTLGDDENSNTMLALYYAALQMLAERFPGLAIIVVAHSGKDAQRGIRGGGASLGNVDGVFECTIPEPGSKAMNVRTEKLKDYEAFPDLSMRMEVVAWEKELDAVGLNVQHLSSLVPVLQQFHADADPGIVWDDETGEVLQAEGLTRAERMLGQIVELNEGMRVPWLNVTAEGEGIIEPGDSVLPLLQSLETKGWVYCDDEQRWWTRGSM